MAPKTHDKPNTPVTDAPAPDATDTQNTTDATDTQNTTDATDTQNTTDVTETSGETNGNGKRGRKPGSKVVRPNTTGFDLNAIAGASVASAEVIELAQPRQERKPEQLAMDKVAERAHSAWVAAGRPSQWNKMPVITYYVDPVHVEGYKYLIRRACDFHGLRVKFGSPVRVSEALARNLQSAGKNVKAGQEILAWAALDKRPKSAKSETNDGPESASSES